MRATERERGSAFDLLAAWAPGGFLIERGGEGVAGAGVAARVTGIGGPGRFARLAREVEATFATISRSSGEALFAVGGASFAGDEDASLVVPARTIVRRGGRVVEIDIADGVAGVAAPPVVASWPAAVPSDPFAHLVPEPTPGAYRDAVRRAARTIRDGLGADALRKVVLARSIVVDAERELDVRALLARLRAVDPDAYVFAVPASGPDGTLVGASPELLVRKVGRTIATTPLAGSAPRFGDPDEDRASAERLFASEKDREEHRLVVEDVVAALDPLCHELSFPAEPELVRTANVWHLATPFTGLLEDGVRSVLDVLDALHPTAAVSGLPRAAATEAIARLESLDRDGYAGPVGWVDDHGDGEWAIALRCALVTGSTARLFAGAGIVGASDPVAEEEETERKFRASLDALRWG